MINIAGGVKRPIKAIARKYPADQYPEIARHASYVDFYGIDSEYDYDPFWAKVVELGVPVTTHYGSQGWTGRQSTSNYMFNHIGHFADGSQAFAKALFFGGVTRRFPNLRVALLEGGADWGSHVYTHLVDRWEKRNRKAVQNYNPAHADLALLQDLFSRYGADFIRGREPDPAQLLRDSLGISALPHSREPHEDELDDFAAAGIESAEDIRKRWVDSFYFGSEADDRTVAAAFNDRVHPLGAKINAIWSRHRPLGRARPDRAAGRKLGPGRTGRHQRAGLQGPGVRQSLPPLHRGQSRFLPGHGDRAQARRPPRRHRHQDPRRLTPRPV